MSATPHKRNRPTNMKTIQEDNNNTSNKFTERQQARTFVQWYKNMVDNNRQNLTLYLADEVTLEWFGRTIKTRKKVANFLKHDMQCSRHDFTMVDSIDKILTRQDRLQRKDDSSLASPLTSPEMVSAKMERPLKRRLLRSNCSPQWAEGCQPVLETTEIKRLRVDSESDIGNHRSLHENSNPKEDFNIKPLEIMNKGDGLPERRVKRKSAMVTPPHREVGQGDCLPSTSGNEANKSHDTLNGQLKKLAVECSGYIEFARTRNNKTTDAMKWERKCQVQISYSEDPLNVGEYILWALQYSDESKCRRNLLAAFEEVSRQEEL